MNGSEKSAVIAAESQPSLLGFNDVTLRGVSRRAKRLKTTLALAQKFQTGNVRPVLLGAGKDLVTEKSDGSEYEGK